VRPNIVFNYNEIDGNPAAEVEVRLAPDGMILSRRIIKSSGVKTWDDAVLRALDRTEVLPKDVDGRVPKVIELIFRPKD
jgi:colicin import membrane protein